MLGYASICWEMLGHARIFWDILGCVFLLASAVFFCFCLIWVCAFRELADSKIRQNITKCGKIAPKRSTSTTKVIQSDAQGEPRCPPNAQNGALGVTLGAQDPQNGAPGGHFGAQNGGLGGQWGPFRESWGSGEAQGTTKYNFLASF